MRRVPISIVAVALWTVACLGMLAATGCGTAVNPDNDSGAVQQQSAVDHHQTGPVNKPDQEAIKPDEEAMTATRQGYAVQTGVVPNQNAVNPAQSAPIQGQRSPVKAL